MAEKKYKTHAEKAAASSVGKGKGASTYKKKVDHSKGKPTEKSGSSEKSERSIPGRAICAMVCFCLFVVFLVIFLVPGGYLTNLIESIVNGLFGTAGFVISIPALLFLFVINAFSGKRPVVMRSVCVCAFVVVFASIAHMIMGQHVLPAGASVLTELYNNTAGGVVGGLFAMLLVLLCGEVLTYILLFALAILTLLGSMQITIPSIVRAIKDRPRADWELEDDLEEKQEPAAIVVNHIANKRIAYIESHRRNQDTANAGVESKNDKKRARDIIRQIDGDIETPVAVASADTNVIVEPIESQTCVDAVEETLRQDDPVIPAQSVLDPDPTLESTPVEENRKTPTKAVVKTKKVKVTAKDTEESAQQVAEEIAQSESEDKPNYSYPPIDLLKLPAQCVQDATGEMQENTRRLNETLASFRIEANIVNVTRGPSVTRYEVELQRGVRLNKLTNSASDIALRLGASSVRIAAIPGKVSVVGIEVPNQVVTTVSLREVIDSQEFNRAKSKASFAVGKDIGGNCIVGNIAKLPHMLIAGTTGSGKSVCMNSIIISLLYKASPEEVKLIMVDPKMVELGIYNGIPHLLIPVVTDPKKAAGSLQWAVVEMLRRYKAMSDAGVRDLESYNSIMLSRGEPEKKLPQIVVIIDELADLMLVAAKEVEDSICRIAQMGRASGIHLIIATQRPSSDVITGLMKANIPSRIAFAVASGLESRIILDTQGAENLVGRGDMLFAPIGDGEPKRVQGCFVSDQEVEAVAVYVKSLYTTEYDEQVMEEIEKKAQQTGGKPAVSESEANMDEMAGDELLPAAVDVILETGQASVSMLQRRLKLGYARAARIVDEMEEKGIVGPYQGSKPREIVITRDQWEAMRNGTKAQMDFDDLTQQNTDEILDSE